MQTCKSCGKNKPITEYYKSNRTISGYRGTCKKCAHDSYKRRYAKSKTFIGHNKGRLPLPTKERLSELFEYVDGGMLRRRVSAGNQKAGTVTSGKKEECGYCRILVDGGHYLFHRIVWRLIYGDEPEFIDHINNIRNDNRIENLRRVDKSSNSQHQLMQINNSSGFFGVSWYKRHEKWRVGICVNSKSITVGYYGSIKDAVLAYNEKCNELHGEFGKSKIIHNMEELKRRGLI
jgi:hypothetical protein